MELASVNTPAAALIAGLVTSLHCVGMCGPLACWLTPVRPDEDRLTLTAVYQGTRLFSYAVLGALAGAAGQMPLQWVSGKGLEVLPWILVAFFFAVALGWDKRVPKPLFLVRLGWKVQQAVRGRSRVSAAALLGGLTPVMPCGPLYFLLGIAAFSGSALRGVEFMLAFGIGTLPLLWLVQANFGWLRLRLTPPRLQRVQAGLALASALVLLWRLRGQWGWAGPGADQWLCF